MKYNELLLANDMRVWYLWRELDCITYTFFAKRLGYAVLTITMGQTIHHDEGRFLQNGFFYILFPWQNQKKKKNKLYTQASMVKAFNK